MRVKKIINYAANTRSVLFPFATIALIRFFTAVSQLIVIAVASQIFSKAEFGRFAISYALVRLLQAGSGLGAQSYLLKDIPYRQVQNRPWHKHSDVFFYFIFCPLMICVFWGFALEGLAISKIAAYPLHAGEGSSIACLAFFWTILITLASYVRVLRSSSEALILKELTGPAAIIAVMGFGFIFDADITVAGLIFAAGILLLIGELIMLGWHVFKPWIPVGGFCAESISFKELKDYWGTVVLNTMTTQLDIVLAGIVLSPAIVGVYTIIKRMTNVVSLATSIVVWMYAPKISRASASANLALLSEIAKKAIQLTIGPAIIIAIILIVTMSWWTEYFDINTDRTFFLIFSLLLGSQILSISIGSTMMFATQTGQPHLLVRFLTRAIVVAAPLTLSAAYIFGIVGVAAMQIMLIIMMKWPVRSVILVKESLDISITALFNTTAGEKNNANKR